MEPETSTPQRGPEQAPIQYSPGIERAPMPQGPERAVETGGETRELAPSRPVDPVVNTFPVILPTPVLGDVPAVSDHAAADDSPMAASDDDLIEKEWVEKAKKIVAETRDDPYKREQAVNKLQKDYLMKRYGRELGEA